MLEFLGEPLALALVGLTGGLLLGLAARLGRFCTLGAIEDALYGGDARRLWMWGVAIGASVTLTFALASAGLVRPEATLYLATAWNPVASVLGGLAFGYGMALAGNCGFGALARVGGGDFRAFLIVLVMGLSAYVAISGPLAGLRVTLFPEEPAARMAGLAHWLSGATGLPVAALGIATGLAILSVSVARTPHHRAATVFWGGTVGLAVVTGWVGTQWIADHGFAATLPQSHSFARPLGETMLYMMTASARPLSFGVGSVVGVVAGAVAGSCLRGQFRWEACDDPRELRRQVFGAALMGVGAVIALGCTIGQGLSAFSVLAVSAPVTMAAIFAGAAIGLRQLITGFLPAA